ncbi:uncharacterized protein LOC100272342 [Zea mays]|uniref:BHLH domain-containing protein n=1 Tax=Zea mays TaxID=4577 RepID=B4FN36_MAIZE|nr:uncharacterized protein LOC100272342 [Zea mays]ACF83529.1 unknown [Zea mays]|eukprot:NP_001140297.1 uncharacterized protein LOC100272342 [Zea mays]
MWNCSSLLLQYGDDYAARCESSSSPAGAVGLDRILAAEYGRFDSLDLSPPPPLHGLQAQTLFAIHGSSENCLGIGANPIYSTEARPAFSQLSFTQPAADTAAHYSMKWTAAGETATGGGGSRLRGSKRLKTKTPATAQGPQHHGQRCSPKPTTSQSIKAPPCKRSQKLGDKITALQQLVSPYGKTDTASVLHEAATCIKHLHEQIQFSSVTAGHGRRRGRRDGSAPARPVRGVAVPGRRAARVGRGRARQPRHGRPLALARHSVSL